MSDSITPDPHDRFFKETFGRTEHAVPFLRKVVPEELSGQIAWPSLKCEETSFLDETLARRSSDLLFSVDWQEGKAYLYCLFEHQSRSDPRMPLRLLRYMVRIWDRWERENPTASKLPLIIPVVLFQGEGGWTAAADLRGLIAAPPSGPENTEGWESFVPVFTYPVVDVKEAGILERFKDWRARHILALLASVLLEKDSDRIAKSFEALEALVRSGADDLTYLRTALTYLFTVSGDIDKDAFQSQIGSINDAHLREESMSIAELLKSEGRQEGLNRGKAIGAIQELQKLLGHDAEATDVLASRTDNELAVERDLLEAQVRKRLR